MQRQSLSYFEKNLSFYFYFQYWVRDQNYPGAGAVPIMAYTRGGGAAPPDRGTFFRRQVYEMVGVLLVIKGVGKSVGKKAEKS